MSEIPDATIQDVACNPPPQVDVMVLKSTHTEAGPVSSHDPPSPKPPSPAMSTDKSPAATDVDDITVTGSAFKASEDSRVLAKHSSKEETTSLEKGKAKLELEI